MLNDGLALAAPDSAHQQDARGNARPAQFDALIRGGDAKPFRAVALKGTRAFDGAVPVGVALDHGAHRRVRSNEVANRSKIVGEIVERDLGPGGSRRHEFSLARKALGFYSS